MCLCRRKSHHINSKNSRSTTIINKYEIKLKTNFDLHWYCCNVGCTDEPDPGNFIASNRPGSVHDRTSGKEK